MNVERPLPRRQLHPYFGCSLALGWLALALALGCSEGVQDETRLAQLTSDERRELCEEIVDRLPSAEQPFTCAGGHSVRFDTPDGSGCRAPEQNRSVSSCTASAGDVRACVDALVADPCGAFDELPQACAALRAAGCEPYATVPALSDCAPLLPEQLRSFEGVYELIAHSRNDTSCAADGASILAQDSERLFVVVAAELLGTPLATLRSCSDLADCQREISAIRESSRQPVFTPVDPADPGPELSSSLLCAGAAPNTLSGRGGSAGSLPEGQCSLSSTDFTLTRTGDGAVRFERATFAWTERDEGSGCSSGAAPAADVPCSELEVVEGRFLSQL